MSPVFSGRNALAVAVTATVAGSALLAAASPGFAAEPAVAAPTHAAISPAASTADQAANASDRTKWSWGNGQALLAKVVTPRRLAASAAYLRVEHNQGKAVDLQGILPDGNGVALDGKSHLVEYTKQGPRPYTRGSSPALYSLEVRGSTVYGLAVNGHVYRFTGAKNAAQKLGGISNSEGGRFAVTSSRVYWTRSVSLPGNMVRSEVVSRPLSGGALRVEAKGARDAQPTDEGILVVRTSGAYNAQDPTSYERMKGIDLLSGPKRTTLLTFNGKTLRSQIGDGDWRFEASGHTLALPQAGSSGQIVINLKNHKAWRVSSPQGTTVSWAGVDGGRAVWDERGADGRQHGGKVYLLNVDSGQAKSIATAQAGEFNTPKVGGKAIGWTYLRKGGLVEFESIVLK